ncbi:MAG: YHS domain-containing protein [Holophagales bacterium]|nr:YHS domain-containing protein [Holophagales bacterium]
MKAESIRIPELSSLGGPTLAAVLAIALLAIALFWAAPAGAVEPVATGRFDDVAVRGYDTVAYFTEGRAVEGSRELTHRYLGAQWRFASAENRDRFAADPEAYAPRYGGYCAWAVAQGKTARIDPRAWKIVDGKLYLNYSPKIQKRWEEDIEGNIRAADESWPGLVDP